MKNTGICPKCKYNDLLYIEGTVEAYGMGNNIKAGLFKTVLVNRYVCTNCGYSEEWIDKNDISKLIDKYR